MTVISVQLFTSVIITLSFAKQDTKFWESFMLSYCYSRYGDAKRHEAKACLKHFF
jgi:hypothetical protein